jgi:uncharacterized protein (DUF58 family)
MSRSGRAYRVLPPPERFKDAWKRFWSWRRLEFSRGGALFTAGAFAIGFAAINTGNNLLFLLLGAMLGFIATSSWLSEQVIGAIAVGRRAPRGVTAGNPVSVRYDVRNDRRRFPAFAFEIGEKSLQERGFVPYLRPGGRGVARSRHRFERRGVVPLGEITVSTSFPFGLFRKTRTLDLPGELVVWPRTDRPIPLSEPGSGGHAASDYVSIGSAGARGEYRGLRGYRPGDDPRDIHWRTSARFGMPVVREYEQTVAETWWICLDTRGEAGLRAEAAVETAASLAARAVHAGKRFGFWANPSTIEPGQGPGHLEQILDDLARVEFKPSGPAPLPPADPRQCMLVTLDSGGCPGFGQVIVPQAGPEEPWENEGGGSRSPDPHPGRRSWGLP